MKKGLFAILLGLALVVFGRNSAMATSIIGPTSATTNMTAVFPETILVHSYDQSGLSASYTSGITDSPT